MRHLFVILDTSGSIPFGGISKVGQVNDLLRELVAVTEGSYESAYIITYSDKSEVYWSSASGNGFRDIPADRFGGRSNLGKAYTLIKEILNCKSISAKDACLVLISDGDATDNFSARLTEMDPTSASARVGGCIGKNRLTLDRHVGAPDLVYLDITSLTERDEFLDDIVFNLTKD